MRLRRSFYKFVVRLVGKCSPEMQASTLYMHHYLIYIFTTPGRDIFNSHQGFIFYQTRRG